MSRIQEIVKKQRVVLSSYPWGDLPEADDGINNLNRDLIQAYKDEHGTVWLGKMDAAPPLWEWQGYFVYNWEASFVVPCYDEMLHRLILDRRNAPYTGTREDAPRVVAILDRIKELGGTNRLWT